MDIVSSCLSIIVLSTWSILHLNVPIHYKPKGWRQRIFKQFYLISRKIIWVGIFLMVPEWYMIVACNKMHVARTNSKGLRYQAKKDMVGWSMSHTYLADMGGIAIRFPTNMGNTVDSPLENPSETADTGAGADISGSPTSGLDSHRMGDDRHDDDVLKNDILESHNTVPWNGVDSDVESGIVDSSPNLPEGTHTLIKEFAERQDRFQNYCGKIPWKVYPAHSDLASQAVEANGENVHKMASLSGNLWLLGSAQLLTAREKGIINRLPKIEEDAINNSSIMIKLLALGQIIWIIAQLITRKVRDLPFAPLEINAVAFAASAFVIYLIEIRKPQNVAVPFTLYADKPADLDTYKKIAGQSAEKYSILPTRYTIPTSSLYKKPCSTDNDTERFALDIFSWVVYLGSFALFGGIHFFAWDLSFPTDTERRVWRISAILTTGLPFIMLVTGIINETKLGDTQLQKKSKLLGFCARVIILFYVAARLFIMAESFRSLYYLKPDTFKSTWAANMPHVS